MRLTPTPRRALLGSLTLAAVLADGALLATELKGGSPYRQLNTADPTTFAMLSAGKCRSSARFQGQVETREVTLDGETGRDDSFHWQGGPKS